MTARHVGRRVEVSDEAHGWHIIGSIGRESGHKIAIVVKRDIFEPHLLETFLEILGKNHLSGCRRRHICQFVTLRVESHIIKKSVNYIHGFEGVY